MPIPTACCSVSGRCNERRGHRFRGKCACAPIQRQDTTKPRYSPISTLPGNLTRNTAKIDAKSLPPTSTAAKFYNLHVQAQVPQWRGEEVNVEERGWRMIDGQVLPITTDLPPPPESLLHIVRCNCKSGCSTMGCSCRKHNLECSPVCSQCRGSSCTNSFVVLQEHDDSEDE